MQIVGNTSAPLRRLFSRRFELFSIQETVHREVYSLHKFLATKTLKRPSSSSSYTAAGVDCSGNGRVRVLDGRAVAAAWQEELAVEAADIRIRGGRPPGLGVILVGDRPDSQLYVARKQEACERAGVHADVRRLPATISQISLRRSLKALCSDPNIDGILVQLPLPPHIDEEDIIEHIDPQKDVDGFHPLNVGRTLMRGCSARFVPCTALGCIELLRRSGIMVMGKSVAIVGDSNIVGMPLAMLFRDEGAATVTVVHRTSYSGLFNQKARDAETPERRAEAEACLPRTPGPRHRGTQPYEISYSSGMRAVYEPQWDHTDTVPAGKLPPHLMELANITRTADIIVVAVGYPHLVKSTWIKPGAVVIDVGINVVSDLAGPPARANDSEKPPFPEDAGQQEEDHPHLHVVGDVDFASVCRVASAVTPVPGGVGPMTIAAVLHNTVHAAAIRLGLRPEKVKSTKFLEH